MNCERCQGGVRPRTLRDYRADTILGLPNVVVRNHAVEYVCEQCGETAGTVVDDIEGLEAAAALERIKNPVRLSGVEIRFLRMALRMRARELADALKIRSETVSRWENGHVPMNQEMEKILRLFVGYGLSEHAAGMSFDPAGILRMEICEPDPAGMLPMIFVRTTVMLRRCNHRTDEQSSWRTQVSEAA